MTEVNRQGVELRARDKRQAMPYSTHGTKKVIKKLLGVHRLCFPDKLQQSILSLALLTMMKKCQKQQPA